MIDNTRTQNDSAFNLGEKLPGNMDKSVKGLFDGQIVFDHIGMEGLEDMHEYSRMPEFYKYFETPAHTSLDETRQYIMVLQDRMKNGHNGGGSMYWFIKLASTKKVIGSIGLVGINTRTKTAEIGLGLSPLYWGKGHIFEALAKALHFFFEELGMERIWGVTHHENNQVLRLYKTAGFKIEGQLRDFYYNFDGSRHDATIFALLRREATLDRCLAFAKICYD